MLLGKEQLIVRITRNKYCAHRMQFCVKAAST